MAPTKRRVIESDDSSDEDIPNAWEEMRRRLEPVSPAAPEPVEVIAIEDTPNPLGDEPSFEILDSFTQEDNVPELPQSPQPGSSGRQNHDEPQRPESPQPGPSGLQTTDDNDEVEEMWLSSIDRNVGTCLGDNNEYAELETSLDTALHGFMSILDKFKATATLAYDYKEAYRASRNSLKHKREDCVLAEAEVQREKKKCMEAIDANDMLIRDLENEQPDAREYKEQRDLAERDVTLMKSEMARMKHKAYKQKQYVKALKETMEDKDATIARLETELSQVRKRLHQFTRISCPRGQKPGSSTWVDAEEDSTTDEEQT